MLSEKLNRGMIMDSMSNTGLFKYCALVAIVLTFSVVPFFGYAQENNDAPKPDLAIDEAYSPQMNSSCASKTSELLRHIPTQRETEVPCDSAG
jgi:hypothetical protein